MITLAVADVILIGAVPRMAMGSCRLFGVKLGVVAVERLVRRKPKFLSAEKETALRLGGAAAGSALHFPTRPAVLPTPLSQEVPL